jgi:uncharacterized membrane protein
MTKLTMPGLTTLDLIKTWALLIMVADHIGFYWFEIDLAHPVGDPTLWWRVIGRLCVPVWFFLIGYARSRDLSPKIWIWATIFVVVHMIFGIYVTPLNVLFSFIIIRIIIDPLARFAFSNWPNLVMVIIGHFLLLFITFDIFEYGSIGVLLALAGYAARHAGENYGLLAFKYIKDVMFWSALALFSLSQGYYFTFDAQQFLVMTIGAAAVLQLLMVVRMGTHDALAKNIGPIATGAIQFMGRHTMELYVLHQIVLMGVAWACGWGHPIYGLFDFEWTANETFGKLLPPPVPAS